MKKTLLTLLAVAPLGLLAQTTILSDNFDSYSVPGTVAAAAGTIWETWSGPSGTAEDADLNNNTFSSASNSMFVKNGGPSAYLNDMILPFPTTYTTGVYEFNLKIYVGQGFGGYFNLGGAWVSGGAGYQYGGEFFFNGDGSGNVDLASTMPFIYNVGAWNDISILVDLDAAEKTLKVNGLIVGTNAWGAAGGFGVADIFGFAYGTAANATEITSEFFIDDVELINMTGVGIEENNLDSKVIIFPSPNNGQFTVEFNGAPASMYDVTILDLSGKVIKTSSVNVNGTTSAAFKLNVTAGVYLVKINNGATQSVQRMVVQ